MSEKKSTKREKNTAQRIKKVRTLRKLGYYVREIMVETGLGINTVKKYISLANEPRGSRTKNISIQQKRSVADRFLFKEATLYHSGKTVQNEYLRTRTMYYRDHIQ